MNTEILWTTARSRGGYRIERSEIVQPKTVGVQRQADTFKLTEAEIIEIEINASGEDHGPLQQSMSADFYRLPILKTRASQRKIRRQRPRDSKYLRARQGRLSEKRMNSSF